MGIFTIFLFVLSVSFLQNGKWYSLAERALFNYVKTGGMIYRSVLAKELISLGYEIGTLEPSQGRLR